MIELCLLLLPIDQLIKGAQVSAKLFLDSRERVDCKLTWNDMQMVSAVEPIIIIPRATEEK